MADEKIRSIGIYIERSTDALVRLNSEKEAFLKWKEVDNRKQVLSINLKRREARNLKKRIIEVRHLVPIMTILCILKPPCLYSASSSSNLLKKQ